MPSWDDQRQAVICQKRAVKHTLCTSRKRPLLGRLFGRFMSTFVDLLLDDCGLLSLFGREVQAIQIVRTLRLAFNGDFCLNIAFLKFLPVDETPGSSSAITKS